jgi:hypothetical protein
MGLVASPVGVYEATEQAGFSTDEKWTIKSHVCGIINRNCILGNDFVGFKEKPNP